MMSVSLSEDGPSGEPPPESFWRSSATRARWPPPPPQFHEGNHKEPETK